MATFRKYSCIGMGSVLLLLLEILLHPAAAAAQVSNRPNRSTPQIQEEGPNLAHAQVWEERYIGYGSKLDVETSSTSLPIQNDKLVHSVPLVNFQNEAYYAEATVGTPPQTFKLALDTGIADVWIPSIQCTAVACNYHPKYDSSKSSTYTPNGSRYDLDFLTGSVQGFTSRDTLSIGGMTVEKQDFAEIYDTSFSLEYDFVQYDGAVGLAYVSVSTNGVVPPFYKMVNDGVIGQPVFGVYLDNCTHDSSTSSSVMTFGGVDESHYEGSLTTIPLQRKERWEVRLDAVSVGSQTVQLKDAGAALDTGASSIFLPTAMAVILNFEIGARQIPTGKWIIDCDRHSLPDVSFNLGGYNFSISGYDYTYKEALSCFSVFEGRDLGHLGGQLAILGQPFLRSWYSVYDMGSDTVGLAKSK